MKHARADSIKHMRKQDANCFWDLGSSSIGKDAGGCLAGTSVIQVIHILQLLSRRLIFFKGSINNLELDRHQQSTLSASVYQVYCDFTLGFQPRIWHFLVDSRTDLGGGWVMNRIWRRITANSTFNRGARFYDGLTSCLTVNSSFKSTLRSTIRNRDMIWRSNYLTMGLLNDFI